MMEKCMVLGLGISGAVKKLTAAVKFYNPGSSTIKFTGPMKRALNAARVNIF